VAHGIPNQRSFRLSSLPSPPCPTTQDAIWLELHCYDRIVKNWAAFGLDLEAMVCKVIRTVLLALSRQCGAISPSGGDYPQEFHQPHTAVAGPSGGMAGLEGRSPGGQRRTQLEVQGGRQAAGPGVRPGSAVSRGFSPPAVSNQVPPTMTYPQHHTHYESGLEVQYYEAVQLNSLKYMMVSVPGIEETLVTWCQATNSADFASMIGHQFDQVRTQGSGSLPSQDSRRDPRGAILMLNLVETVTRAHA